MQLVQIYHTVKQCLIFCAFIERHDSIQVKVAGDVNIVCIVEALDGYSVAELKTVAKDVVPLRKLKVTEASSTLEMEQSEIM